MALPTSATYGSPSFFTDSGGRQSEYYLATPASPQRLLVWLHGDGTANRPFEFRNGSAGYTLWGADGIFAQNPDQLILAPMTPDHTGDYTWWENASTNVVWLRELIAQIRSVHSAANLPLVICGYSGGAQILTEDLLADNADLWTASGGGSFAFAGGDAPVSSASPNNSNIALLRWATGQADTNDASGWNAYQAAQNGSAYYRTTKGYGAKVETDFPAGVTHSGWDGLFGSHIKTFLTRLPGGPVAASDYVTEAQATALATKINERLGALATGGTFNGVQFPAGVSTSNPDNTQALYNAANAAQSLTSITVLKLPPGVLKGHLPMAPGVVWDMVGVTFRFPDTGPANHMVYPLNPVWAKGCRTTWDPSISRWAGNGAHRSGIIGPVMFDGEASRWNLPVMPDGPTPTGVMVAGGSIPADPNGFNYRISYRTQFGDGRPGRPGGVYNNTAGSVRLTWTNSTATGVSTAQIVIWGRGPWGDTFRELVVLPPGTTTWTDNGSIALPATTTGSETLPWAHEADMSAPSILLTGANITCHDVRVTNIPGTGFCSRWEAEYPIGEALTQPMESNFSDIYVDAAGSDAIVFAGPHDTKLQGWYAIRPGNRSAQDRYGLYTWAPGPYVIENSHVWGWHGTSIWCSSYVDLQNVQVEGCRAEAIHLDYGGRILGAKIFSPINAGAKGLVLRGGPVCTAEGIRIEGYDSTHGASIDLTGAPAGSRVSGAVIQNSGTVISGGYGKDIHLDVSVSGGASAQSVHPVMPTMTQAAYTALGSNVYRNSLYPISG